VCHTIIVENKDNDIQYNASSPDELALANAARYFGVIFQKRDSNNMIKIKNTLTGEEDKYELLNVIEFTSTRKRMSVIVRSPDNKILCMTKGADSIIIPRLLPGQEQLIEHTVSFLEECANEGLRTLLIAQKEVDPDFYEEWNKKYSNALSSFKDRQKQIDEVSEIIENDFILIGSTAIEDKLQDNVG
jgi:magnesium-transporting ATPase (P-type)